MTKLIALAIIAAGTIAADSPEIATGAAFESPADIAETLLTAGQAKLADPAPSEVKKTVAKLTKARLLTDCALGKCNDVVELDAAALKEAETGGLADSNKAAVAYAMTLA
ncbi:MAG: hypothetical protein Q7K57_51900 [Burkholderiaceae bacterium]|nr:hypothetical protein [Burkholderiaceae bacterium]